MKPQLYSFWDLCYHGTFGLLLGFCMCLTGMALNGWRFQPPTTQKETIQIPHLEEGDPNTPFGPQCYFPEPKPMPYAQD